MRRLNVGALRSPPLSAEFPVSLVPKRMKKKTKKGKKEEEENKKVFPRVSTNVKISTLDVCPFICPSVIVQSRESSKQGKSAITDRGFRAPHTRQTYDFTQSFLLTSFCLVSHSKSILSASTSPALLQRFEMSVKPEREGKRTSERKKQERIEGEDGA